MVAEIVSSQDGNEETDEIEEMLRRVSGYMGRCIIDQQTPQQKSKKLLIIQQERSEFCLEPILMAQSASMQVLDSYEDLYFSDEPSPNNYFQKKRADNPRPINCDILNVLLEEAQSPKALHSIPRRKPRYQKEDKQVQTSFTSSFSNLEATK